MPNKYPRRTKHFVRKPPIQKQPEPELEPFSVKALPGREYFPACEEVIDQAKKRIRGMFFQMFYYTGARNNRCNKLFHALARAKARGVEVQILLNNSFRGGDMQTKHQQALVKLEAFHIKARIFPYSTCIHTKLILADNNIIILGSHNWTNAGLNQNVEASCVIRDKAVNEKLNTYFMDKWRACESDRAAGPERNTHGKL